MLPYMATLLDPKSKITPHLKLLALNKMLTLVNIKQLQNRLFKLNSLMLNSDSQQSLGFDQKFTRNLDLAPFSIF